MTSPVQPTQLRGARWLAERFDVQPDTVFRWCRTTKLPHIRVGRSLFFDERAIEAFIAGGGTPGSARARTTSRWWPGNRSRLSTHSDRRRMPRQKPQSAASEAFSLDPMPERTAWPL